MDKLYFVYILTNYTNTTLYTGITANIKQRIYLHKNEIGSVFTTKYKTNKLVYYEVIKGVENAIKKEKQVKNLLRRKKIALINSFNPSWKDLYDYI